MAPIIILAIAAGAVLISWPFSFWVTMWTFYFAFGFAWFGLAAVHHPVTTREWHAAVAVLVVLVFLPGKR
jgi:hypothetical protein